MKEKNLIETAKMQGNVMVRDKCFADLKCQLETMCSLISETVFAKYWFQCAFE